MPPKKASVEFDFVREKLEKVARILVASQESNALLEVSFIVGCLHNICHENALFFREADDGK